MPFSASELLFWSAAACCLVAQLLVLRSLLSPRGAGGHTHPSPGAPRKRSGVELLWALLPAVALAIVLFATWNSVRSRTSGEPPRSLGVAAAGE